MKKIITLTVLSAFFMLFFNTAYAAFPVKTNKADVEVSTTTDATSFDADATAEGSGKSQTTALVLAIFLGLLGIHRFYLGYTVIGIIQLLTGGGFGIWTLIDIVRIITGDLQPKDGSYSETL